MRLHRFQRIFSWNLLSLFGSNAQDGTDRTVTLHLLYSLLETAKANNREPYAWLRFAVERLPMATTVDEHQVDGDTASVTGVAKNVMDCFKYRNKIGLE